MKIQICTLFESSYHFGVSVLVNSLYAHGFRGTVYAGYRGEIPRWASHAQVIDTPSPIGISHRMTVTDEFFIEFIPLKTEHHLTNHKPDFMISLFEGPAREADALYYIDPDIVLNEKWAFIAEWITCGVALSEDLNSPLSINHPRRQGWRRAFSNHGYCFNCRQLSYANGGLIGSSKENLEFLEIWKSLQDIMFSQIGGGQNAGIVGGKLLQGSTGFADCFGKTDQDALNAAVEVFKGDVSILGQMAMGFKRGHAVFPHAIGNRKPWAINYLKNCLLGIPPRHVDKLFWKHAAGPIQAFSPARVKLKRISVRIASLIARFYHRL